jgi:hypothetical protein
VKLKVVRIHIELITRYVNLPTVVVMGDGSATVSSICPTYISTSLVLTATWNGMVLPAASVDEGSNRATASKRSYKIEIAIIAARTVLTGLIPLQATSVNLQYLILQT